jgi:hypothetical protein
MEQLIAQLRAQIKDLIPPAWREYYNDGREAAKPVIEQIKPYVQIIAPYWKMFVDRFGNIVQARRVGQVGDTFRSLCVVGLNRSELLLSGERMPVFADSWQELVDDSLRRGLAILFFAPRGYDGQPVDPYLFLAGEVTAEEGIDASAHAQAQAQLGGLPLLDLCRMAPAAPNTVNILLAADVLFHWDVKDNYVLPTTPTTWARDVESVLKSYPRTTRASIYTAWETEHLPPNERITVRTLRELPLDTHTWLNRPTFQEQYGSLVLVLGMMMVATTWGLLTLNARRVDDVNEQLRVVEQQIPSGGKFGEVERVVTEQERMMQKRELFYLTVKDASRAIELSNFKTDSFEVKSPDADTPPDQLLVTVEAKRDAYSGWLQEEPAAKAFLLNSALIAAVRKQPSGIYKLEGLVPLGPVWREYQKLVGGKIKAGDTPAKATAGKSKKAEDGQ